MSQTTQTTQPKDFPGLSVPSEFAAPVTQQVAIETTADTLLGALVDLLTPRLLATLYNVSISANTPMLQANPGSPGTYLTPGNYPTKLRVYCAFNQQGTLSVVRYLSGNTSTSTTENLNPVLGPLIANGAYTFDIQVDANEQIQLQYSVAATALKVSVWEVDSVIG